MNIQTNTRGYTAKDLKDFLLQLYDIGAVKVDTKEGFKLKLHETNPSAPLSPFYISLRIPENKDGKLTFAEVSAIARFFYDYAIRSRIRFVGTAGVPNAGIPFVKEFQAIAYEKGQTIPMLTLDKQVGDEARHIGKVVKTQELPRGCRVLLFDDLITKAGSKVEAIEEIRKAGFEVNDCLVFVDREQGGGEELANHGVKLHSIVSIQTVFSIYREEGIISQEDYAAIISYLKNN